MTAASTTHAATTHHLVSVFFIRTWYTASSSSLGPPCLVYTRRGKGTMANIRKGPLAGVPTAAVLGLSGRGYAGRMGRRRGDRLGCEQLKRASFSEIMVRSGRLRLIGIY
jgi:hypothetical protein